MSWTKELAGALAAAERPELAALMAEIEGEEAQSLAPTMIRIGGDVEALVQEVLAADVRRFLAEFDQRRASLLDALARVAGGPLPAI